MILSTTKENNFPGNLRTPISFAFMEEKQGSAAEEDVPMDDKSSDEVTQLNIFRFNVATPGSRPRQPLKRKPEKEVDQTSSANRVNQDCRQQGSSRIIFFWQL